MADIIDGLKVQATIRHSLQELSEWMRTHTGPKDGTHDMLVRAHYALEQPDPAQTNTITITVEGGCVTDVEGLPDGWDYRIADYDHPDEFDEFGIPPARPRECNCGSGSEEVCGFSDGRGVYLFLACRQCFADKRKSYRADIFDAYECDEPIGEDY